MANKPVWIICDKMWAEKIRNGTVGCGCPPPLSGKPCPKDADDNVLSCRECWSQFIDFEITDEEGDAE